MLGLDLGPRLQLITGLTCTVCEQLLKGNRQEDFVNALLFGAASHYVFCPACLQEVPEVTRHEPEYRRRARVTLFEKYGLVLREPIAS